jgi:hypothetical protein
LWLRSSRYDSFSLNEICSFDHPLAAGYVRYPLPRRKTVKACRKLQSHEA